MTALDTSFSPTNDPASACFGSIKNAYSEIKTKHCLDTKAATDLSRTLHKLRSDEIENGQVRSPSELGFLVRVGGLAKALDVLVNKIHEEGHHHTYPVPEASEVKRLVEDILLHGDPKAGG